MITLDVNDLYVNLPIRNILHITKFWLNKHNNVNTVKNILYTFLSNSKAKLFSVQ
jgi:hypothetical protein